MKYMNICGKTFYTLRSKGLERYRVDDIGIIYDTKEEIMLCPRVDTTLKQKLYNKEYGRKVLYPISRLILASRGKLSLYEKDVWVYPINGLWNDMVVDNLKIYRPKFLLRGSEFRFTQRTGRIFYFLNFKQFCRVYEGMTKNRFLKKMQGDLNGCTLEYRRDRTSEWIMAK